MKKLISLVCILLSLMVLINCSPKTAKKTAASQAPPANSTSDKMAPATIPQVTQVDPVSPITDIPADVKSKTIPKITDMGTDQQLAIYRDMAPLRLEIGHKIYTQSCNKCHKYYPADSETAEKWLKIMTSMGPKAKLDNDQYMMVTAYLVNNARK